MAWPSIRRAARSQWATAFKMATPGGLWPATFWMGGWIQPSAIRASSGRTSYTQFASETDSDANAIAIDPNGRIVVAGWTRFRGGQFALARYNPDGGLDPTFDADGKALTQPGDQFAVAQAIALDAKGKIVVAGRTYGADGGIQFALARFNADGSLDPTFDGDGTVFTDFAKSTYEMPWAIALDANGKIMATTAAETAPGRRRPFLYAARCLRTSASGRLFLTHRRSKAVA